MTRALIRFDAENIVSFDLLALLKLCEFNDFHEQSALAALRHHGEFRDVDGVTTVTTEGALAMCIAAQSAGRPAALRQLKRTLMLLGDDIEEEGWQ